MYIKLYIIFIKYVSLTKNINLFKVFTFNQNDRHLLRT